MSDWWWYAFLVVVIVASVYLVLRIRRSRAPRSDTDATSRDYTGDREAHRVGEMSDEDREWEAASLRRSHEAEERDRTPPGRA
ncbi:MAG TPA: hypothetical protein VGR22_11250 [Thermomicrobiales bacterium]|nr:hypothetical protein [Thermomicrobiales bacterium]